MLGSMKFLSWPFFSSEKTAIFSIYDNYVVGVILTKFIYWCVKQNPPYRQRIFLVSFFCFNLQAFQQGINFNLIDLFLNLIFPVTYALVVCWLFIAKGLGPLQYLSTLALSEKKIPINIVNSTETQLPNKGITGILFRFEYLSYQWIFIIIIAFAVVTSYFSDAFQDWMDRIKDEEYLVGRTLHNIDEPQRQE